MANPHGSDEHRAVGLGNEILRVLVGSGLHGTAVEGQDDRDEMGICIEPPEYVIGLRDFEQYIFRTQPEGARSGPGDLDLVVYCHAPESRVLTADLEWRRIDSLRLGQRLVTFDEQDPTRDRHRHFSTGTVTGTETRIMDRCRVVTSEGSTVVTPEHLFLVRHARNPRTRWVPADRLRPGDAVYHLPTWREDRTWEAGYLAGQFDGDGSLHFTRASAQTGVPQLSWVQKMDRPDVPRVERLLSAVGFKTRTHGPSVNGCAAVHVAGGWPEQMRFLGTVRPPRLLGHPELPRLWEQRSLQVCGHAYVEAVETLPAGPMVAMETSTRTYVADGLLTHNSLRKFTRLAMQGNPTVLLPLFVPDEHVVVSSPLGRELRAMAGAIVSRQAAPRFLGYLAAQRDKLLGRRSGAGRPELIEKYGFDAKFAMHMVRLGVQGVELLETGRITLPMPEPWLSWCRALRRGERSQREALEAAAELELRLRVLHETSPLPPAPDRERLDAWLVDAHQRAWADRSLVSQGVAGSG